MARDKSATHYRFTKNGESGWIFKGVWDGYTDKEKKSIQATGMIVDTGVPIEVKMMGQKQKADVLPEAPIEVKKLAKKQKTEVNESAKSEG